MSYLTDKQKIRSAPHYFALLGVHAVTGTEELKTAHRKLARVFHPDVNADPDAAGLMAQINVAYETLLDKDARRKYLMLLKGPECAACKGKGATRKQKGFKEVLIVQCPTCKGAGKCC